MTPLNERVATVDEIMRTLKTSWVADNPETTDLLIYVHLYRGEDIVATLQCPLDRDTMLQACWVAVMGMAVDVVITTVESWHSKEKVCPLTGEPWEPGEMAFLGQTSPEAREKGWVWECLNTMGFDRFQHVSMISTPYRINGTEVTYFESMVIDSDDDDAEAAGYLTEQMRHCLAQPTILDRMEAEAPEMAAITKVLAEALSEEQKMFHIDCAALGALAQRELIKSAALMAENGSERARMIEERFGTFPM